VLTADAPRKLIAEVLPAERMAELTESRELNLSVPVEGVGNFRFSAMHQRGSVAAVIRYIPASIPPLETLNLPAVLAELALMPRGLLLVVGGTGAGKSTTMAAMLDYRNAQKPGHILTVEDPIEFIYANKRSVINQREVGTDTQSLHVGLKNALRQAPDVIMIGEIRDRETMTAAMAYAQSGHLCIASLHANNAYQTLNRILSFYPVEVRPAVLGDLAASLKAVVAQRLLKLNNGVGRAPANEVLLNTHLISELIEKGDFSGVRDSMEKSITPGTQTFDQDLVRLVREGRVNQQDAVSYADSPTNLLWLLQNDAKNPAKGAGGKDKKPQSDDKPGDESPSFTHITLDVRQGS
jgi:twitching motility protein PilU